MNAIAESPAYHKRTAFEPALQQAADRYQALGHPARLAILLALSERRACVCGDLVELLPLAQATVSRHLKALKDAGFVQGEIDGPRACYCLTPLGHRAAAILATDLTPPADTAPDVCC